jgi:dihydrofolate reductase
VLCRRFASLDLGFRWTDLVQVWNRVSTTRSERVVLISFSGSFTRLHSARCMASRVDRLMMTSIMRIARWRILAWPDENWKGWWGEDPPYHAPTFVLTHHERDPLVMKGGTTFYFVTAGIEEALQRAKEAAGEKDVKIGGGVATVRQYLQAGLIDSLHLAVSPVLLGRGEALFTGIDLPALGFSITERTTTPHATHIVLEKR